jgi:hypothetical protein
MERLHDTAQMCVGLVAQALNNSNATGRFYLFNKGRRVRAWLIGGAMAATKTSKIELVQAQDADGTGVKAITGAEATVTANALVTEATIALASVANTDVAIVNGISFTKAAATSIPDREFADAAGLVSCINSAAYGVPGVFASAVTTTVTVRSEPGGEVAITTGKVENAGTITLATTQAQAFVDLDVGNLDLANGFVYVAAKVTTTADSVVSASLDIYPRRFDISQAVGAQGIV